MNTRNQKKDSNNWSMAHAAICTGFSLHPISSAAGVCHARRLESRQKWRTGEVANYTRMAKSA